MMFDGLWHGNIARSLAACDLLMYEGQCGFVRCGLTAQGLESLKRWCLGDFCSSQHATFTLSTLSCHAYLSRDGTVYKLITLSEHVPRSYLDIPLTMVLSSRMTDSKGFKSEGGNFTVVRSERSDDVCYRPTFVHSRNHSRYALHVSYSSNYYTLPVPWRLVKSFQLEVCVLQKPSPLSLRPFHSTHKDHHH